MKKNRVIATITAVLAILFQIRGGGGYGTK